MWGSASGSLLHPAPQTGLLWVLCCEWWSNVILRVKTVTRLTPLSPPHTSCFSSGQVRLHVRRRVDEFPHGSSPRHRAPDGAQLLPQPDIRGGDATTKDISTRQQNTHVKLICLSHDGLHLWLFIGFFCLEGFTRRHMGLQAAALFCFTKSSQPETPSRCSFFFLHF